MFDFEKLGAFYLGKEYEMAASRISSDYVMYDARDLTTHAVIVGMTGSGKTGLGITLLEEAAVDGIPALIIDPKGDMGNLLLNFPELKPSDFLPWLEQDEAARKGKTLEEYAVDRAQLWKNGLEQWEQGPDRLRRLQQAADVAIYTPGSDAGLQLTILKSLAAPPREVRENSDAMREQVATAVSGLLTLLGIDADPLRSREHILLSNIVDAAWRQGRDLDMAGLIHEIQTPPFQTIGIMDLETIFPAKDRLQLAMTVNNILASPAFASWMQGEPLSIPRLLYTDEGKPRLAVLSIAHLNDQERMFFVTLLLNEIVAWMRTQPGTSSLRAILYMDEVFGYLPPTANPPSKLPLLTLLKQARAYGLGLILATQNPVDLDYKALSNAGTWFLGRLQTERDKLRVLDGLEGASASAGVQFDRQRIAEILAGVSSRVFLMNNVHENQPVLFQTRWAMSYLSGPMTRAQISTLMADAKEAHAAAELANTSPPSQKMTSAPPASMAPAELASAVPPILPTEVPQKFVAVQPGMQPDTRLLYRPALLGEAALHFVDPKAEIDAWRDLHLVVVVDPAEELDRDPWNDAEVIDENQLTLAAGPVTGARYSEVPSSFARKTYWKSWGTSLKSSLYREHRLTLSFSPDLKQYSRPEERAADFAARLHQSGREKRDIEVAKLRKKYESRFDTLSDRIRRAKIRVEEEKEQANSATVSAMVSIGTSILGALFGRKTMSATNVSRAGTSVRSATRAADQRSDIQRAEAEVAKIEQDRQDLEKELELALEQIAHNYSSEQLAIEPYEVKPRKSDIEIEPVSLLWLPYSLDESGAAKPAFSNLNASSSS